MNPLFVRACATEGQAPIFFGISRTQALDLASKPDFGLGWDPSNLTPYLIFLR